MKRKLSTLLVVLLVTALMLVACSTDTPAAEAPAETPDPVEEPAEEPEAPAEEPAEGLSGEIHVYTRDATSGTREAFEGGIGFDKDEETLTASAVETSGNGDMASKVGNDVNGIGYVSLTTDFAANNLKPLNFEGVEPTIENVLSDDYSLKRPFSYVTRAAGDFESDEAEALTRAFIAFITESEEGLSAVDGAGGIVDLSSAKPWSEVAETVDGFDPATDYSGITLRTRGSTSVDKTLKAALEAFQAEVAFEFNMDHTGSGDGFKRVLGEEKDGANAGDIGFASRKFGDNETVSDGMLSGEYCQDAVVVVVESSNPLSEITQQQIHDIIVGQLTTWEEL